MRLLHLILVKPEDMEKGSVYHFSEQIINTLRTEDEIGVVGFGNAVSLTCMAVQLSSNIAKVLIGELTIDYVGSPTLGLAGVFFLLTKESTVDWEKRKNEIESKMKLNFEHDGQLVIITKKLPPERIIPLCLTKLSISDLLEIVATGSLINRASSIVMELTKGKIAKDIIGIKLVSLSTVKFEVEAQTILDTRMTIILEKGSKTSYSEKHKQMLKLLEK